MKKKAIKPVKQTRKTRYPQGIEKIIGETVTTMKCSRRKAIQILQEAARAVIKDSRKQK